MTPVHELDIFNEINLLIREETAIGRIDAANLCKDYIGQGSPVKKPEQAWEFLNAFWKSLLEQGMYLEAAVMNWGYSKFDGRPHFARAIFDHLPESSKSLIQAASSASKTYSIVCWLYLDWQRDPLYTAIKCLAVNEAQLRRNIFTHLYDMHEASAMDVAGGVKKDLFLGDDASNLDSGWEGITTPQGQASSGRVKGIKPKQRPRPHPVFVAQTRTRIFVDEFQNVPEGMEKDFASPLSSAQGADRVKLILSGNPEDITHVFGTLAEPKNGWVNFDLEKDFKWVSKRGYNVLRLDGAQSENVIAKEEIYPGILSWQGFQDRLLAGETSIEYICFARGSFPVKGSSSTLISRPLIDRCIGEALYHEGSKRCAAVDIALRQDKVVLAYGRYGLATGWRDSFNVEHLFSSGTSDKAKSRFIMQLEGFEEVAHFDGDAIKLCKEIMRICKELNVEPRNLAVDSTGLGEGVYSYLKNYFGEILGVNWTDGASEMKIMKEDAEVPRDKYYKAGDEMWFAAHTWMSYGCILISRRVPQTPFFDQLTNRRLGKDIGGKRRMEGKDEYKLRSRGASPDETDSFLMMPQLLRARSGYMPSMSKEDELNMARTRFKPRCIESIDSLRYNSLDDDKKRERPFDINMLKQHIMRRV